MAAENSLPEIKLPTLPAKHDQFIQYIADRPDKPLRELLRPYDEYDAEMRKVFAQNRGHPATATPNIVPVFGGHERGLKVRARDLRNESIEEKESYIMPLKGGERKASGSPAVVQSLQDFRTNFSIFSESSLTDLDWSNVVVAGSAVVTSLLHVPEKRSGSKRALREYYHEHLAPASDVDLFLYGLTEEQAIEKIKQIERSIRDSILAETTTVRTKNAITIASEYPTRHVQIVLRIYSSISEILTGFDVDCSCAAFDGKQVYASPRALCAYMSQVNRIDLTRRSPSYENRLSKYAHRGFEVYWPLLDRSKVDPTIFERSFGRVEGLARLLVLEKLPKANDRDGYLDRRREERGRPAINRWRMRSHQLQGNIKNDHEDEVAEWVDSDEVSDYHTFTIPYGAKFNARRIEKLLYTKDLLLNAEWNRPKDREVNLHRHPAFFGRVDDVIDDCCGYCPKPGTMEEEEAAEEEGKIYVSGRVGFIQDDPGRQTIGSFNPLTPEDWTDMAYVGNTARLCQAIVDGDAEYVRVWLEQEGNDPNTRDYTGRTPLHLAVSTSSLEIVQCLIDGGARLVARLVDGKTALHLAALRGSVEMVSSILRKSEANEEEEEARIDARRKARAASVAAESGNNQDSNGDLGEDSDADPSGESDIDMVDAADASDDDAMDTTTERSMVKVKLPKVADDEALAGDEDDEPDVYDVNVLAWDAGVSPLHLAIISGHCDVVKCLVQEFGADVLLPIKLLNEYDKSARAAILTMVLALQLPTEKADEMTRTLIELGATSAQADLKHHTALEYCVATRPDILGTILDADEVGVSRAINHLGITGYSLPRNTASPLLIAIRAKDSLTALRLLTGGAKAHIDQATYTKACESSSGEESRMKDQRTKSDYHKNVQQPVIVAVQSELPDLAAQLVEDYGEDINTLTYSGWWAVHDNHRRSHAQGTSLLDVTRTKIDQLKQWKPSEETIYGPHTLKADSEYLSEYTKDSYLYWSAWRQLEAAKNQYKVDQKNFQERIKTSRSQVGIVEKKSAIRELVEKYEKLETILLNKGAKTFAELYPDIDKEFQSNSHHRGWYPGWTPPKPTPFEVSFHFIGTPGLDEVIERYKRLFEAAWGGNLQEVKELTLKPWKNSEGQDQPPLQVSARDQHGMSPFVIAILHGSLDLATAIMQIAQAQYVPQEDAQNERYRLDTEDDEDNEDSDDLRIYKEIIDDQFTIETIGEISTLVRCHTSPVAMMLSRCQPAWDFVRSRKTSEQPYMNPITFALHNDDADLLTYLLSLGEEYTKAEAKEGDQDARRFLTLDDSIFFEALRVDRPHLTAEIIRRTGAGIPFKRLIEKSGIEVTEKPKYYQGLSVYGKKRQDWANAGRRNAGHEPIEDHRPPLLEAARRGALETVEWFLSEAPMRCYRDFAARNQDDKRLKWLSEAPGGFEASVSRFLNVRSKLAIHSCVMSNPGVQTTELLQFLIKSAPDTINTKSREGMTPLHIAFRTCRYDAARMLIEAGADQTCRDRLGRNILHHLLTLPGRSQEFGLVERMFDLVDKRLIQSLCTERSTEQPGAITPLAQWISNRASSLIGVNFKGDVLRTILRYSEGAELNMLNGEGNCPLHVCVRDDDFVCARTLLEHDPTLLLRENSTGRTPFEMAEDSMIAGRVEEPPVLPGDRHYSRARPRILGVRDSWKADITERQPHEFGEQVERDRRSEKEKLWDLLCEIRAHLEGEGRGKRRLVTLNEANEVARRLAATTAWAGSQMPKPEDEAAGQDDKDMDGDEDQEDADEVKLWLPQTGIVLPKEEE